MPGCRTDAELLRLMQQDPLVTLRLQACKEYQLWGLGVLGCSVAYLFTFSGFGSCDISMKPKTYILSSHGH